MKRIEGLAHEFDSRRRILHLSAEKAIRVDTLDEGVALYSAVRDIFKEYASGGRFYLIVDLSKILIDPALADKYCELMKKLSDEFLHENGRAAYGYEITRLTVFLAHTRNGLKDPNFFASRFEAESFIESQAAKQTQAVTDKTK